jgi:hypothetical protein
MIAALTWNGSIAPKMTVEGNVLADITRCCYAVDKYLPPPHFSQRRMYAFQPGTITVDVLCSSECDESSFDVMAAWGTALCT